MRGHEEATQQQSPLDGKHPWYAVASGQAHGARTGTSGEETHPDWKIRGAEDLDRKIWGRNGL